MKKLISILSIGLLTIFIAACGNASKKDNSNEVPQAIDVTLQVPEKAAVNETVNLKAMVKQGNENVADADEVKYEIWEDGKEESQMKDAKNEKDGTYTSSITFDHDGVYTIQVHVTARGMHTMPKSNITVGNATAKNTGEIEHEGHEETTVEMNIKSPVEATAGKETKFDVEMKRHGMKLEDAAVQIELWNKDTEEKHEWVQMKETEKGEYTGTHTLTKPGNYQMKIHVENNHDLHEHQIFDLEVK